jgi:hypothetical protein
MKYTTKDVTKPKTGLVVYMGNFWLCEDGDPTKALFYGPAPQCNKDKRILHWRINNPNNLPENTQIVFINYAYVPQAD